MPCLLGRQGIMLFFVFYQINGMGGGGISRPDAVASGRIMMVVGTGSTNDIGGPSNHILSSTSVTVVGAKTVVPAIVAIGRGGGGINAPSIEADGLDVLGNEGNPIEGKGENKEL